MLFICFKIIYWHTQLEQQDASQNTCSRYSVIMQTVLFLFSSGFLPRLKAPLNEFNQVKEVSMVQSVEIKARNGEKREMWMGARGKGGMAERMKEMNIG